MVHPSIRVSATELAKICRAYGVRELALFGSALRVDFRPESDLDFLVQFRPEARVSLITLGLLEQSLAELMGRRVDLVPESGLRQPLRDEILAEREVLYAA